MSRFNTWKNKKVKVFMKNGDYFIDHFVKEEGKLSYFKKAGAIRKNKIRTVGIYKGKKRKLICTT